VPHDIFIGDVYIPPLLAAAVMSLIVASLITRTMTARGVMSYFANPPLVFMSLAVMLTVIFGSTLFPT
jgi:hypothetical protein